MNWGGPGLLKGQLHLQVYGDRELLSQVVTDELYLNEGRHRYQLMLPASSSYGGTDELNVRLRYVEGSDQYELPSLLLRCPSFWSRRLVLGVVRSSGPMDAFLSQVIEELDITTFWNPVGTRDAEDATARLVVEDLAPRDFPVDPLHCCAFDMLIVDGPALAGFTRKQSAALLAWTQAGGSVLIFPAGKLETHQLELLQALDAGDSPLSAIPAPEDVDGFLRTLDAAQLPVMPSGPLEPLAVNSNGELVVTPAEALRLRYAGLGRVLIVPPLRGSDMNLSVQEWREAIAFLWKARWDQLESVRKTGTWDLRLAQREQPGAGAGGQPYQWPAGPGMPTGRLAAGINLAPQPLIGGAEMMQGLLPASVQLVPFGVIALILGLFLLAIGPFDYWLLGRLKRRKLTWLLFPCLTLAFTVFSVWLSNLYMGSRNHRRALVIRDVDAQGAVIRESRFEMLFNSQASAVTTDVRRALFLPLDYQSFFWNDMWTYAYRSAPGVQELVEPPLLTGRLPIQGTVVQRLPQWTPQLNRLLTIPLPTTVSEQEAVGTAPTAFDWSRAVDPGSERSVKDLRERALAAFGPDVGVYVYEGHQRRTCAGEAYVFADSLLRHLPAYDLGNPGVTAVFPPALQQLANGDFLQQVSVRKTGGWFALMSQVSPGCGPYLEDLAVLDPSDRQQGLLVIAIDDGTDKVVYRRQYRRTPEADDEDHDR